MIYKLLKKNSVLVLVCSSSASPTCEKNCAPLPSFAHQQVVHLPIARFPRTLEWFGTNPNRNPPFFSKSPRSPCCLPLFVLVAFFRHSLEAVVHMREAAESWSQGGG